MQAVREHPLGERTPYAWTIETVRGCNLRCGHCCCRLFKPGKYTFMSERTWRQAWNILNEVSPTVRVDLCIAGEPTLHPHLVDFIRIAREISPRSQMQVTTNGTMLRSKGLTCGQLLSAGANFVYVDMYGQRERFTNMARRSGFPWYEYYAAPANAPSPWTYHGPDQKCIILQEQPENWPRSRRRAGLLGTWLNHLDWEAAARFGLKPVTHPPTRRCNQPFIYVPVHVSGAYLLCCQDGFAETAGQLGSVKDGVEGFKQYWLGKKMMLTRRCLRNKNRLGVPQCARCSITFSRCDYVLWKDDPLDKYWDGSRWRNLPARELAATMPKPDGRRQGFGLLAGVQA